MSITSYGGNVLFGCTWRRTRPCEDPPTLLPWEVGGYLKLSAPACLKDKAVESCEHMHETQAREIEVLKLRRHWKNSARTFPSLLLAACRSTDPVKQELVQTESLGRTFDFLPSRSHTGCV